MASNQFEVFVRPGAEAFYKRQNETDRAEIDRLVGLIQLDPRIDGVHKFMFASEVIVFTVYDNNIWTIVYRVTDNTQIEIWAVERADATRRSQRGY